jgi:hypothetical protein
VDAAEAGGGVGVLDVELGLNFFCGEGCEEQKERGCAAIQDGVSVCWHWPPLPRQKVCKVFEEETLGLDFGSGYGTKVESPACAGLGFLPDLIVAAVSRVGRDGSGLKPLFGAAFSWAEAPRLILKDRVAMVGGFGLLLAGSWLAG